jgi:hypothetical protein
MLRPWLVRRRTDAAAILCRTEREEPMHRIVFVYTAASVLVLVGRRRRDDRLDRHHRRDRIDLGRDHGLDRRDR